MDIENNKGNKDEKDGVTKERKIKFVVHTDDNSNKDIVIVVNTTRLLSSKLFSNMVDICHDGITLPHPKRFNDVVDNYINYLICGTVDSNIINSNIINSNTVNRCLQMCHYILMTITIFLF